MDIIDSIYNNIKELILECGSIVLNANDDLEIQSKDGNNNIVTKYDVLIQNKLKEELLNILPGSTFMGEEGDTDKELSSGYTFIVDPIDGTTNFARNMHNSAISIALLYERKPILAFCYNPYTNELYEAIKGRGAKLNDKPIHVSNRLLKNGLIFTGSSPYYNELRTKSMEIQSKLYMRAADFRRTGSAVIELCALAAGKAEVFFELQLMPWDYAAASLIILESGGTICTIEGEEIQYNKPSSIFATNGMEDYLSYIK